MLRSNWALAVLDVSGLDARGCDGPVDAPDLELSERGLNRKICERWVDADAPELPDVGGLMRLDDPAVPWVPDQLPILPVPLGLPTSDGCGRELRTLSPVFGEYRNVLEEEPGENELGRSEPALGPKLRGLEVPTPLLGDGLKKGRGDGAA